MAAGSGKGPFPEHVRSFVGGESSLIDSVAGFEVRRDGSPSEFPGRGKPAAQCLLEGDSGFLF
jgi:hypothetical protein